LQQQINLIRRFFSNVQTPDSAITLEKLRSGQIVWLLAGVKIRQW
jgi:hypothetical protein